MEIVFIACGLLAVVAVGKVAAVLKKSNEPKVAAVLKKSNEPKVAVKDGDGLPIPQGYRSLEQSEVALESDLYFDNGEWISIKEKFGTSVIVHADGKYVTIRNAKCKIPEGYRLLKQNEKIRKEIDKCASMSKSGWVWNRNVNIDKTPQHFGILALVIRPISSIRFKPEHIAPIIDARRSSFYPYGISLINNENLRARIDEKRKADEIIAIDKELAEKNIILPANIHFLSSRAEIVRDEIEGKVSKEAIAKAGKNLPDNYRYSKMGEVVIPSDISLQLTDGLDLEWRKFEGKPFVIENSNEVNSYATKRRGICEAPSKHRFLKEGEEIRANDVVFRNEKWDLIQDWATATNVNKTKYESPKGTTIGLMMRNDEFTLTNKMPNGYRFILKDEVVMPSDIVFTHGCWLYKGGAELEICKDDHTCATRRHDVCIMPVGYRILNEGEEIKKGDKKRLHSEEWGFVNASNIGKKFEMPHGSLGLKIREIEKELEIPAGYRNVEKGEIIMPDDLLMKSGSWVKTSNKIPVLNCHGTIFEYITTRKRGKKWKTADEIESELEVPQGYRKIEDREVIMPNDLLLLKSGLWSKSKNKYPVINFYGKTMIYATDRSHKCIVPNEYWLLPDGKTITADDRIFCVNCQNQAYWAYPNFNSVGSVYADPITEVGLVMRKLGSTDQEV